MVGPGQLSFAKLGEQPEPLKMVALSSTRENEISVLKIHFAPVILVPEREL